MKVFRISATLEPTDGLTDQQSVDPALPAGSLPVRYGMGWPTGGFADKMGNRFEAHCVVAAALELIEGNATTIEWEGVGSDFDGIEYRRRLPDGTIECVQCKGSRDKKWTIATLASEGLLGAIRDQLTRYPSSRFRLVLASSAGELADLTERARAAATAIDGALKKLNSDT